MAKPPETPPSQHFDGKASTKEEDPAGAKQQEVARKNSKGRPSGTKS